MKKLLPIAIALTFHTACAASGPCNVTAPAAPTVADGKLLPIGANAISVFDGKTLKYTYGNGKTFTNRFKGDVRVTVVKRGTLNEKVLVTYLGYQRYFVTWKDDNMGMVAQVVDLENRVVRAAVPLPSGPKFWTAKIELFE